MRNSQFKKGTARNDAFKVNQDRVNEGHCDLDGQLIIEKRINTSVYDSEEWLTSDEAAKYLRISVESLRNETSNGKIPYCKLGRRNRYLKSDLRKLLLSQKRGVSNGN